MKLLDRFKKKDEYEYALPQTTSGDQYDVISKGYQVFSETGGVINPDYILASLEKEEREFFINELQLLVMVEQFLDLKHLRKAAKPERTSRRISDSDIDEIDEIRGKIRDQLLSEKHVRAILSRAKNSRPSDAIFLGMMSQRKPQEPLTVQKVIKEESDREN